MITAKKNETMVGKTVYYIRSESPGGIGTGVVVKLTPKFCVMTTADGGYGRKARYLVFETEDEVKFDIITRINGYLHQFDLNILELNEIFKDMITKYPEKFV